MGAVIKFLHAFKAFVQKVGKTITKVINTILVAIAYIVAIGPTSIALRITGGDPLDKKWDPDGSQDSYWRTKENAPDDLARYTRQF